MSDNENKTHDALYSKRELMLQARIILIRRQINPVEARVTLRELVGVAGLLDRESPRPVGSLKVLEPVDRDTRCARGELQEARLALGRPAAHTLPEPLDDFVGHLIPTVIRKLGPVVPTRGLARLAAQGCHQTYTSISDMPPMSSSNSRSSKTVMSS